MERDNISIYDGVMRGFTYEDAVIMLRNTNPDRGDVWENMKKDLRKWVQDNVTDMMYLLDQHKDEVWAAAYPDEVKPLRNHPNWDEARCEALAQNIQKWLREHEMWIDTSIYYNGKCMSTAREVNGKREYRYNGEPFIEDNVDPRNYFEYVAKEHIMSMSFEGPLYHVLNAYVPGWTKLEADFQHIFDKHGCYYEMGHAWNLTCYEG